MSNGVDKSTQSKGAEATAPLVNAKGGTDRVSGTDMSAAMPIGAGETLDKILSKAGQLSPLEALRYLTPLFSVLGALHDTKQAHGKLSIEVLRVIKGDDGALRLQLLKGSKAPPTKSDASAKAALQGRMVIYSSADLIQGGQPSERDDMYSVAHIAYHLLVGEPYWAEESDRLGFMALCKCIMVGIPEAPSVRAMRRKNLRLPQDFDAWFVLATDSKHADRFGDITDAGIALRSVLSNPDIRELSRSVQFKFNPNILDMPAAAPVVPTPEPDNLRSTAIFTIVASISVGVAIVLLLRWTNAQGPTPERQAAPTMTSAPAQPSTPNPR